MQPSTIIAATKPINYKKKFSHFYIGCKIDLLYIGENLIVQENLYAIL